MDRAAVAIKEEATIDKGSGFKVPLFIFSLRHGGFKGADIIYLGMLRKFNSLHTDFRACMCVSFPQGEGV